MMRQLNSVSSKWFSLLPPLVLLTALVGCTVGKPVPRSGQSAQLTPVKAKAEQGNARAQVELGLMYLRSVPPAYDSAAIWLLSAASQGDAEAQWNLGMLYTRGEGVPKDDAEAAKWLRLAATGGWPPAEASPATASATSPAAAPEHKQISAATQMLQSDQSVTAATDTGKPHESQQSPAVIQIARISRSTVSATGPGKSQESNDSSATPQTSQADSPAATVASQTKPQDAGQGAVGASNPAPTSTDPPSKPLEHNEPLVLAQNSPPTASAAGQGNPQQGSESPAAAQTRLGMAYATGHGKPPEITQGSAAAHNSEMAHGNQQDYVEAVKRLLPPAESGYAEAQYNLGLLYANGQGVPKDDKEAMKWFRLAAEQGWVTAQTRVGVAFATGQGTLQNWREAFRWLFRAADSGDAEAEYNLGMLYFEGQNTRPDLVEAAKWYNLAAAQGHELAVKARDNLNRKMTVEQIADAQQRAVSFAVKTSPANSTP